MQHELGEHEVEACVVERDGLGPTLTDSDARMTGCALGHERGRGIERRYRTSTEPIDEHAGQRPRSAPGIERGSAGRHPCRICEGHGKPARIPAHERVVGLAGRQK